MHRGRKQLGQEIALAVLCKNASGVPTDPDAAPTLEIYSRTAKVLSGVLVPTLEPLATTGLFQARVLLDERFSAGRYHAVVRWLCSATLGMAACQWEILPGGDATGAVLALHAYERPQASFLVQQRASGRIFKGKNPRV